MCVIVTFVGAISYLYVCWSYLKTGALLSEGVSRLLQLSFLILRLTHGLGE